MRQVIHSFGSGVVEVIDVPRPRARPGTLVVANELSVISAGTERMLVAFGSAGPVGKMAREPTRVRQVLNKIATDGLLPTVEAVRAKLEEPIPLGYSSVGIVHEVGQGVTGFGPGDRVATNGPHAELTCVSAEHAVVVPDEVASEDAVYTVLASVALQALRDADVPVGGVVVVVGLGLIGQLVHRIAEATGCRVLGYDVDSAQLGRAGQFGDPETLRSAVRHATGGEGADAVVVTAEVGERAKGADPLALAQELAKFRGRIVLVGGGDPQLDRRAFYERELQFRVSHSYGGRRNFATIIDLLRTGRLEFRTLTSAAVELNEAPDVYQRLAEGALAPGLVFRYPTEIDAADELGARARLPRQGAGGVRVAVVGAGNYASRTLLPTLASTDAELRYVASLGLSSALLARRFAVASSTTNFDRILADPNVDAVFVATRHDSHAELACAVLDTGKHLWLEKPIGLTLEELDRVENHWRERPLGVLAMVGFNRRFAPTVQRLKSMLSPAPKTFVYTVNAGQIPRDHWLNNRGVGGGRFIGEAIHFLDLGRHLAGSPLRETKASLRDSETGTFTLEFADGSLGTVHYFANGSPRMPKERLEVFDDGRVFRIENFRRLEIVGSRPGLGDRLRSWLPQRQDKGHASAVAAFLGAIRSGGPSPVPFGESLEVSRVLLQALEDR